MKNFDVPICRIGYGFRTISIEAESQEEANEKALDEAGNYDYSEKSSDYVLQNEPAREIGAIYLLKEVYLMLNVNDICAENKALLDRIERFVGI